MHKDPVLLYGEIMVEDTIEELAGYISGNIKRKQVIDVLDKKGSETFDALAKITRIPRVSLERMMSDMAERGVVIKEDDMYKLTGRGDQVTNFLRRV